MEALGFSKFFKLLVGLIGALLIAVCLFIGLAMGDRAIDGQARTTTTPASVSQNNK